MEGDIDFKSIEDANKEKCLSRWSLKKKLLVFLLPSLVVLGGIVAVLVIFLTKKNDKKPIKRKELVECTWDEINEISTSGKARENWRIGDTTAPFKLGDREYTARLIGFNHDELANGEGKKAGVTFEFVTLLDKTIEWATEPIPLYNHHYPLSELRNSLEVDDDSVYALLPDEIKKTIKPVIKLYSKGERLDYGDEYKIEKLETKIFALSFSEMGGVIDKKYANQEGKTYEYYNIRDQEELKKRRIKMSIVGYQYWLRSPNLYYSFEVYSVLPEGNMESKNLNINKGIAPAFCV